MSLQAGDRVHQSNYGLGEIVELNRQHVTVAFDDGTTRKFAAAIVQLEPSTVPLPPREKPARAPRKRTAGTAAAKKAAAKTPEE